MCPSRTAELCHASRSREITGFGGVAVSGRDDSRRTCLSPLRSSRALPPAAPGRRVLGRNSGAARLDRDVGAAGQGDHCPGRGGRSPRPRRRSGVSRSPPSPVQRAGDGPVGDPPGGVHAADPLDHALRSRRHGFGAGQGMGRPAADLARCRAAETPDEGMMGANAARSRLPPPRVGRPGRQPPECRGRQGRVQAC